MTCPVCTKKDCPFEVHKEFCNYLVIPDREIGVWADGYAPRAVGGVREVGETLVNYETTQHYNKRVSYGTIHNKKGNCLILPCEFHPSEEKR